jgi:hypothetical protein
MGQANRVAEGEAILGSAIRCTPESNPLPQEQPCDESLKKPFGLNTPEQEKSTVALGRAAALAPGLLLAMLALVLCIGALVPIYIDETMFLLMRGRVLVEAMEIISPLPQCVSSYVLQAPASWWPGALLYAALYSWTGPLEMRLVGITIALVWLGMLYKWIALSFADQDWQKTWQAISLALLSFGVLPFVMVLARPEGLQVLCLVALVVTYRQREAIRSKSVAIRTLAGVLSISVLSLFYYVHPKSLFYTPFVLGVVYFTWRNHGKAPLAAMLAVALLIAYQTQDMASLSLSCSEAPKLEKMLSSYTLQPAMLISDPLAFLGQASGNLVDSWNALVGHAQFSAAYQSGWLPETDLATAEKLSTIANVLIAFGLGGLALASVLGVPALVAYQLTQKRLGADAILGFGLVLGVAAQAALYKNTWHFYNIGLAVPVLILAVLLTASSTCKLKDRTWHAIAALFSAGAGLVSLVVLLTLLVPALVQINSAVSPRLKRQELSTQTTHTSQHLQRVQKLATACGISLQGERALLIDDMTYHAFERLVRPVHVVYVSPYYGADLEGRLGQFMTRLGGQAIITRCQYVPPQLTRFIRVSVGGYCCGRIVDSLDRTPGKD